MYLLCKFFKELFVNLKKVLNCSGLKFKFMKTGIRPYWLLAAGLALCACSSENVDSPEGNRDNEVVRAYVDIENVDAEANAVTGDFSLDFLRRSYSNGENILVSPASLSSCLAMLANACEGEAQDEIVSVVGGSDRSMTIDRLNGCWAVQTRRLEEISPIGKVSFANSIWLKKGLKLNEEYSRLLQGYFEADAFGDFNFASKDAARTINDWVSDRTEGMIPSFIDFGLTGNDALLINTVYVNMPWSFPFEEEDNEHDVFHNGDGSDVNAEYMYMETPLVILNHKAEDAELLRMPMGPYFEMSVVMPDEGVSVEEYLSSLSFSKLNELFSYNTSAWFNLHFPKFVSETRLDNLVPALGKLGIKKVFNSSAVTNMLENPEGFSIGRIFQNNKIEVKEDGVAAASASGVTMNSGIPEDYEATPKELYINRPFIYFIRESRTGLILFAGVVNRL